MWKYTMASGWSTWVEAILLYIMHENICINNFEFLHVMYSSFIFLFEWNLAWLKETSGIVTVWVLLKIVKSLVWCISWLLHRSLEISQNKLPTIKCNSKIFKWGVSSRTPRAENIHPKRVQFTKLSIYALKLENSPYMSKNYVILKNLILYMIKI